MKLYFCPGTCSRAPHIVLRETGLPHTLVRVSTKTHQTADGGDYYKINPKGQVPVLELDDGALLTEGPVIVQYLADRAGRTDLMPAAGTMERYRVMEWQNYVGTELHKSFSPLFSPSFDAAAKEVAKQLLRRRFEWVDSQLQGRSYLTGENFTGADAYLFAVAGWTKMVGPDVSDLPNLQRFLATVAERPSVRQVMEDEKRSQEG
jgi:glutathione S-transferase